MGDGGRFKMELKPLVCDLHAGGSGVMVAGVWDWNGRPLRQLPE